jgi:hypothetical protein
MDKLSLSSISRSPQFSGENRRCARLSLPIGYRGWLLGSYRIDTAPERNAR